MWPANREKMYLYTFSIITLDNFLFNFKIHIITKHLKSVIYNKLANLVLFIWKIYEI